MVEKDYKHLVGGIKRVSLTLSPSAANPLYGTKILNLKTPESDFYFDLQWNLNHFGNSVWYIEKL